MSQPAILTPPGTKPARQQNLAPFRVYVAYRSLLSVVLLIMLISPNTRQLVGVLNPGLYVTTLDGQRRDSVVIVGPGNVKTPIWDKGTGMETYQDTAYYPALQKFVKIFVSRGKNQGLPPEYLGQRLVEIFETPNPKTRYAIVPDRLTQQAGADSDLDFFFHYDISTGPVCPSVTIPRYPSMVS